MHSSPKEIAVFGKALYFLATTVLGARTLGEEYVDIMYVNRLGRRMPLVRARTVFVGAYVFLPYIISRVVLRLRARSDGQDTKGQAWSLSSALGLFFSSYISIFDTITNLHVALFYFQGHFYSISKRIAGLRYVFGHNKDRHKIQKTGNYAMLGAVILLQFAVKLLLRIKQYSDTRVIPRDDAVAEASTSGASVDTIATLKQLSEAYESVCTNEAVAKKVTVDLANPAHLPYVPLGSRSCMLCLAPMVNPSAANCGHMFCWECIVGWVREHPECPLCRQVCIEQNLLPLR